MANDEGEVRRGKRNERRQMNDALLREEPVLHHTAVNQGVKERDKRREKVCGQRCSWPGMGAGVQGSRGYRGAG